MAQAGCVAGASAASAGAAEANGAFAAPPQLQPRGGAPDASPASPAVDQAQLEAAVQKAVQRLAGMTGSGEFEPTDRGALSRAIHQVVEEEVHAAFESEMAAVHTAFEQEMSTTKQTVKEAVDAAFNEGGMKFDVTANVNTVMAITAVVSYWRGIGGLLDILFEDTLEGYVACLAFGWLIIWFIRALKLPVVEGNGLNGF